MTMRDDLFEGWGVYPHASTDPRPLAVVRDRALAEAFVPGARLECVVAELTDPHTWGRRGRQTADALWDQLEDAEKRVGDEETEKYKAQNELMEARDRIEALERQLTAAVADVARLEADKAAALAKCHDMHLEALAAAVTTARLVAEARAGR